MYFFLALPAVTLVAALALTILDPIASLARTVKGGR